MRRRNGGVKTHRDTLLNEDNTFFEDAITNSDVFNKVTTIQIVIATLHRFAGAGWQARVSAMTFSGEEILNPQRGGTIAVFGITFN